MRDRKEAALLRAIAEEYGDNSGRAVLSDLLEERGDSTRSEFLRVQCELASADLPEGRRHELRVRERALLDAHRRDWLEAFGLPLEAVSFERGLIAAARPSEWDGGKLLDAPGLVTLTELDLSDLKIGDAGLAAFAERADSPALRKLLLNGNDITSVGVAALAGAKGLPRLETVYLFDNPVGHAARVPLGRAAHFRVTDLDIGETVGGYLMSPGQADVGRRRYLRQRLWPLVSRYFAEYERLQSALLSVAQYWADEANDAVHGSLRVSELFEPIRDESHWRRDEGKPDPNVPNTHIKTDYGEGGSIVSLWGAHWDGNFGAIPLWAAFAPEGGSEDEPDREAWAPAVMFYRHGGYDILPMVRPHLNGIRPTWDE